MASNNCFPYFAFSFVGVLVPSPLPAALFNMASVAAETAGPCRCGTGCGLVGTPWMSTPLAVHLGLDGKGQFLGTAIAQSYTFVAAVHIRYALVHFV